jgi:hypothetical protein
MFYKTSICPSNFLLLLLIINSIQFTYQCDIVGASACPFKPENELKEENFEEYCKKYKDHIECVYKKYKGCDRKEKYVEAMDSMVKGLRKKAKQIGDLCEIEIDVPVVTPKPVDNNGLRNNGHTTLNKAKKFEHFADKYDDRYNDRFNEKPPVQSSGPPCRINTISTDCHPILTNVQFNPQWNGMLKQKWCNSATAYHQCIKGRIQNCVGVQYMESLSYYDKIEKYIHSQSNVNCPGGLEGCLANPNDIRCKLGVKYGEASSSANFNTQLNFLVLFFLSFYYWLTD